jgi:hypothetical protein
MNTMTDTQLGEVVGGADNIQQDLGQFLGGTVGWFRANTVLYLLLGPGIGGIAASITGVREATL